MVREFNRY